MPGGIGGQYFKKGRRGFKGVDIYVPLLSGNKEREESDVRSDIKDTIAFLESDAMS